MPDLDLSTRLNLLTPNGILRVSFPTVLEADQYSALMLVANAAETIAELDNSLRGLAAAWGMNVSIEVLSRKQA